MKLNERAENYEPVEFKNIADFDKIPVDMETYQKEVVYTEGEEPKLEDFVKLKDVKGVEYEVKVPKRVLAQLKAQLEKNPGIKNFSVAKTGEGKQTDYTVIPLTE